MTRLTRLLILRDTVAGGRVVKAGDVIEASPADAAVLLRLGKAVPADDGVERAVDGPARRAVGAAQASTRAKAPRKRKQRRKM